jgi:hypothetical protein
VSRAFLRRRRPAHGRIVEPDAGPVDPTSVMASPVDATIPFDEGGAGGEPLFDDTVVVGSPANPTDSPPAGWAVDDADPGAFDATVVIAGSAPEVVDGDDDRGLIAGGTPFDETASYGALPVRDRDDAVFGASLNGAGVNGTGFGVMAGRGGTPAGGVPEPPVGNGTAGTPRRDDPPWALPPPPNPPGAGSYDPPPGEARDAGPVIPLPPPDEHDRPPPPPPPPPRIGTDAYGRASGEDDEFAVPSEAALFHNPPHPDGGAHEPDVDDDDPYGPDPARRRPPGGPF